uniref:Reverse transcriptase domain-containing protein n=1 Tax=Tanacetum cinerariifolium TaxID=118510 RepID=A0A6L2M285_TANCI|nr:reverse transcriptase domain-containing protein [Tanacetum cinerariifolium]
MTDNRTMAELLRAPTERYAESIVVPLILAEQLELKHSLINMITTDQFFGLEKDNPHDHIRWFNKITPTIKYKDVPSSAIKLMLFPFSLAGAARRWLEKEPRVRFTLGRILSQNLSMNSSPSRTTNLRNEISNFQQRFDESFYEAWDTYKDLLRACPYHSFTELYQLDTFYNALNPADQDSLNAAAGGNLLERKMAKLTHAVNQQTNDVTTAITTILKHFQATPPPAPVKAVEETYVTCGAAVNYNQGNLGYRPPGLANQIRPPASQNQKVRRMNEANMKAMQTQIDMVKNELRNEMKSSIQNSLSNQTNEIKNMMASLLQINTASTSGSGSLPSNTVANPKGELKAITTRSGLIIDGPNIPTPSRSINPKEDEHVEETFTDPDLAEYTIKYHKMLKALLSNKEKLQELANTPLNENYSADILKKLPKKLRDLGKFLIPCGFNELKCKALADLGASINLMPLSVWNKLADFVIADYESDPRVPFILGRPFLRTARALIDVHGEEMILHDGDERLTLNMRHDTSSYSNHPRKESINLINVFNNSSEEFLEDLFPYQPSGNLTFLLHPELTSPKVNNDIFDSERCDVLSEKLLDLDSTKDLHPPLHDNPLSGSTTYPFLEEFVDELPPEYDDNLQFDIESDLKDIEFLLYHDKDSSLKDSIDQKNHVHLTDIFVDSIPAMFTDEHTLDYSSPPIFDVYADDLLEVESDAENIYNDPFDSKGEKIKESKLLIDELDLPCDFHPPLEYDSFISQDFSKLAISNASLVFEDFNPPFYEPLFFKEVPTSKMLLPFLSENEEKVFKPGIHTFEKFIRILSQKYLIKAIKFSKSTRFSKA